jgi:SAM-dependent methyltransferase
MPDVTPDAIMKIAMGFMASKHLFAANEVGLFERLAAGPSRIEDVAASSGTPASTVRIIADAMVSLGLVERDGERYRNGDVAAAFLSGRPGPDLRPMLRFWNRISYPTWMGLEAAVRTGKGQSNLASFSAEDQQVFSRGVESFSAPVAAALAQSYDFARHRRVLDLGGGTGSFLLPILRRHTGLGGTLFELPGACAVARQRLAGEPEGARIDVVEGDFLKDPLPKDHDAFLVANTVHALSEGQNRALLKKAREYAPAGARLLLVDLWTDPTRSEPAAAAMMSGEFLVLTGEGRAYSEQEADGWFRETGWRKVERKTLAGPGSLIVAETA